MSEWGTVRIRIVLINKIEKHLKKHPEFGNVSNYVSYVINQGLEN